MDSHTKNKISFRKSFGNRFCLAAYIFLILSSIPSITIGVMIKSNASMAQRDTSIADSIFVFWFLSSFIFVVPIIRRLVIQNCIKSYSRSSHREPKLIKFLIASFKLSWVHIPLFILPPFISLIASGGNFGYAGVGAIGSLLSFCAYLFAIDIPFRTKKKILTEISNINLSTKMG